MSAIASHIADLVGRTPLLDLARYGRETGLHARILAKLEFLNPAGSLKDRTARSIILDAEANGRLRPGSLIVDLTSGNTGIALAALGRARGYRSKFYARDCISREKITLLRRLGADVVSIPNAEFVGPKAKDRILARVRAENPDAFFSDQLGNPANPRIHYETTGPEILEGTGGHVDYLVASVGTGGTISGAGRFLKEHVPKLRVVAVEPDLASIPSADNLYPDQIEGVHRITGVDPEDLPATFTPAVVDEAIELDTAEARRAVAELGRTEGLFAGLSSGATLHAATVLALRPENAGKTIVAIFADTGERYLSEPIAGPGAPRDDDAAA